MADVPVESPHAPSLDSVWSTISVLSANPLYPGQRDNTVRTTRYRWWTFLPLTLYEQYRVLINVYFLIVLLVCILPWSPVNYLFQLVPMIVVLVISMVKSGIEDLLRHAEDQRRNASPVTVYRDQRWTVARASSLRVGDLVRITEDSMVPADLLFVGSEQAEGRCYFSEANLNGETAVKTIQAHRAFEGRRAVDELSARPFAIDVSAPDRDLGRFDARLRCGAAFWSISARDMLLRGVSTHFTEGVLGVVVRTGHDTKVMQNARKPPSKMTRFDVNLNRVLVLVFCFKIALVLVCTFLGVALDSGREFAPIRDLYPGYGQSWFEYFAQYFILYSYMFPISCQVTLESMRLFHSIVIHKDPAIFDEEFGFGACRNSNVVCQLGTVSHVLSDKTGTLTENIMELRKFVIGSAKMLAQSFLERSASVDGEVDFLVAMAICNSVIVFEKPGQPREYKADSPDEEAFVSYAAKCGVVLEGRTQTSATVRIHGAATTFSVLAVLPFDSDRKRQSVLVQSGDGPAVLYCKGADQVIAERSVDYDHAGLVNELATEGLRTLVFARKEVPEPELSAWVDVFRAAESSLNNRDALVAEAASGMETGLSVIAITGLEDRLQPEVPETIAWLRHARIRVWVLTGDKLETAIAIGKTSGIVRPSSSVSVITGCDISNLPNRFAEVSSADSADPILIITGDALELAIDSHFESFIAASNECSAVILARASPYLKAQVAEILRQDGAMVLAVGDGANDVSMLQTAHVGVGICGREGSQAILSGDFALPRFRFLRRLLMIHGHWTYRRFSVVSVMMLYKNFVFIVAQLWFSFETLWSPTSYYNDFLMSCFNLLFTVWPPFIFGYWDQDLPQDILLANPQLYPVERDSMATPWLAYVLGLGIFQSACAYYGVRLLMPRGSIPENGTMSYLAVVYIVLFQVVIWHSSINAWAIALYLWQGIAVPLFTLYYIYAINWELMPVLMHAFITPGVVLGWVLVILVALLPWLLIEWIIQRFWPSRVHLFDEALHAGILINEKVDERSLSGELTPGADLTGMYTE